MKKAVAEPDPNPVVGIGRGEDYAKVTEPDWLRRVSAV